MHDYIVRFRVDQTPQEVFDAIVDVPAWWSRGVTGVTDQVDGEFVHRYQDVHRCRIRVTELVPGRRVTWRILDNYFNFIQDQSEWKDTTVVFEITEKDGGTELSFTHVGLVPAYECYDVCVNAWDGYVGRSLRTLISTGEGQPNPREEGDAPDHQDAATMHRTERTRRATP